MYTLKCYKHDGIKRVFGASSYTIYPPKANAQGEIVTTVESHALDGKSVSVVPHHVCLDPLDFTYKEIYVENMTGKTIDVIRGSIKAYADPNAGQASEIEYPIKEKTLELKADEAGVSAIELLGPAERKLGGIPSGEKPVLDPDSVGVGPGQSLRDGMKQAVNDEEGRN